MFWVDGGIDPGEFHRAGESGGLVADTSCPVVCAVRLWDDDGSVEAGEEASIEATPYFSNPSPDAKVGFDTSIVRNTCTYK